MEPAKRTSEQRSPFPLRVMRSEPHVYSAICRARRAYSRHIAGRRERSLFRESQDLFAITPAEARSVEDLRKQGYAVLPDFVPTALVDAIFEKADRLLRGGHVDPKDAYTVQNRKRLVPGRSHLRRAGGDRKDDRREGPAALGSRGPAPRAPRGHSQDRDELSRVHRALVQAPDRPRLSVGPPEGIEQLSPRQRRGGLGSGLRISRRHRRYARPPRLRPWDRSIRRPLLPSASGEGPRNLETTEGSATKKSRSTIPETRGRFCACGGEASPSSTATGFTRGRRPPHGGSSNMPRTAVRIDFHGYKLWKRNARWRGVRIRAEDYARLTPLQRLFSDAAAVVDA